METSYGINITNRYHLFLVDDNEVNLTDPVDVLLKKKKTNASTQPANAAQPQQQKQTQNSTAEKENIKSLNNLQKKATTNSEHDGGKKDQQKAGTGTQQQGQKQPRTNFNKSEIIPSQQRSGPQGGGRPERQERNQRDGDKPFERKERQYNNDRAQGERGDGYHPRGNNANNPDREGGESRGYQPRGDRPPFNKVNQDGETREQRNNRRNRFGNEGGDGTQQQPRGEPRGDREPRQEGGGGGGGGGGRGGYFNNNDNRTERRGGGGGGGGERGGRRNFDERRGKREFDRQSGSDKTGIKAVDKRDGAGAHNWGSHKQDIDDLNRTGTDLENEQNDSAGEQQILKDESGNIIDNGAAKTEGQQNKDKESGVPTGPTEEETKEITLDEWKAQQAGRAKPQYNLRKAGEGEDLSQWKKMIALENKKKEGEDGDDFDASLNAQRVGRQKHVLDIEFHFNDGRRGGGMGRGRGGRGRGGPRGGGGRRNYENNYDGERRNNTERGERGDRGGERGDRGGDRGERGERGDRGGDRDHRGERGGDREEHRERGDRRGDRRDHHPTAASIAASNQHAAAPKVDDEHDFPSLG